MIIFLTNSEERGSAYMMLIFLLHSLFLSFKNERIQYIFFSEPTGKKEKNPPLPSSQASTYGNYGNYGNSSSTGPYPYSGSQQGQYNYSQYGQSDQYQYGNWQYPQGGYSGYNQWSGYSGGYGY